MDIVERIPELNWENNTPHVYRYKLANGWLQNNDKVLDVGCGIGYGAQVLSQDKQIDYIGLDIVLASDTFLKFGKFISDIDLDVWEPDFNWDVSVCFETLEHVKYPQRLADNIKKAKRLVILSTPTRPSKHMNPYHLHDFTVDEVLSMFSDCQLLHIEDQPEVISHIFVWKTNNDT